MTVVGESGSGKSTLLRGICGLLPSGGKIVSGDIQFDGKSLIGLKPKARRALLARDMAMIFQDTRQMMNPLRTIGSQLVEYICAHTSVSKREAWEMGVEQLAALALKSPENLMHRYPFELSGGQLQRFGIGLALLFKPRLLLADEPTSALDVTTQAQIVQLLLQLREQQQASLLLVTHHLGMALYLSDIIVVMQHGKVVEVGHRDQLLHEPNHPYTRHLLKAVPRIERRRYS